MGKQRYSGWIGVSDQQEVSPGVWEDVLAFMPVLGTVLQTTEVLEGSSDILPRYRTTTSISVVSRFIQLMDQSDLRVITFKGKNFQISSVVDDPPEITMYIGEEFHGG